tara:strand:+ start:15957 stop:16121 length:165 start_codon:yes stop_codon:yes gene_type:complete
MGRKEPDGTRVNKKTNKVKNQNRGKYNTKSIRVKENDISNRKNTKCPKNIKEKI